MAETPAKQNIQMKVDETRTRASYANAFRHHATTHEVILDFGINVVAPPNPNDSEAPRQMNFQIDNRLVMNYITAKRLTMMLGQLVQAHEKQFGEIKID